MSRALYARQAAAGAWGATVATPSQLRTVRDWGVPRVLLANELLDPREIAWLRDDLARAEAAGDDGEVWLCVDSPHGVDLLARGFADAPAAVRARLGVLVELGVPGGRTGVRSTAAALDLARAVRASGLRLLGATGYEGSVAGGTSADELGAVAAWCEDLRTLGTAFVREGLAGVDEPLVLSAGGSSFLDVVLAGLPGRSPADGPEVEVRVVVRSGAYVTHDHGFYSRTDPGAASPASSRCAAPRPSGGRCSRSPSPGSRSAASGAATSRSTSTCPSRSGCARSPTTAGSPARARRDARHRAQRPAPLPRARRGRGDHRPATAQVRPGDVVGFGISHPARRSTGGASPPSCAATRSWTSRRSTSDPPRPHKTPRHPRGPA